jgi:hypothetical protein
MPSMRDTWFNHNLCAAAQSAVVSVACQLYTSCCAAEKGWQHLAVYH